MLYATISDAQTALQQVEMDVAADMGDDAVEACWHDLVLAIAGDCTPDVRRELLRREGVEA